MIVFIGLWALRFKPLLSHCNIPYSGGQNQTPTCVMLWEMTDMIQSQCCPMSAIQIYNHVVIKNKCLSPKPSSFRIRHSILTVANELFHWENQEKLFLFLHTGSIIYFICHFTPDLQYALPFRFSVSISEPALY